MEKPTAAPGLTPAKGLIVLLGVVVGVATYLAIGGALGITPLYAGFAFSLNFGGLKHSDPKEFPAALVGSLGGIGMAAALHLLPEQFGTAGMVVALIGILLAIYALLMGWVPILVNYAFMLMLTIATIPAVKAEAAFLGMAGSVLLAAALLGALLLAGSRAARKAQATASAA
ncbi:hypothetical protein [Rhizorhabdus sp. FW153]|uniref:hypothetical protein n=1 Tax=Rhizorhabdus sp. FW153 TaxID=3400216 RepID=UPI003CEF44CB